MFIMYLLSHLLYLYDWLTFKDQSSETITIENTNKFYGML